MNETLTVEDIAKMKRIASEHGIRSPVAYLSREAYIDLRLAHDPFGIYHQRRLMSKVLPSVVVYRGDEWWHG